MAHGWDSYFHNLPSPSVNPNPLTGTSGSVGSLSQQGTFVGHHDFTTRDSNEVPATNENFNQNCYSNPSVGNSSSSCVYQGSCKESQWQADAEHMEKKHMPRCGNSNTLSDFSMDTLSTSGPYPAFDTDLPELKQDCGILAPTLPEEFSDVSSCLDADFAETRPSCKFMENSFLKPQTKVPTKDSSSEWLIPRTENITFKNNSICPNMPETSVHFQNHSNVKVGEIIVNSVHDKMETYTSQDPSLISKPVTTIWSETVENRNVSEKSDFLISGHDTTMTGDGMEEYQDATEEEKKSVVTSDMTSFDNEAIETDCQGKEIQTSKKHQPMDCRSDSHAVEPCLQIPESIAQDNICKSSEKSGDNVERARDENEQSVTSHSECSLKPGNSCPGMNPYRGKESTDVDSNGSCVTTYELPMDTNDTPVQDILNGLESCMQSNDSSACHSPGPQNERTSPSESKYSPNEQKTPHQSKQESFSRDVADNARESFKELDMPTEEQSVVGMLYGEPLSGEDSSCDADETTLDMVQNKGSQVVRPDIINRSEKKGPQLKSLVQMQKRLHPVVVLETLESMKGMSNSYMCADCQTTTHNVDMSIEHHHSCHSDYDFQFCDTCDLYLMAGEQADKHKCDVIRETHQILNSSLKKKKKRGGHRCSKCGLIFSRILHFIKHMRTHTGKTPYKCNGCGMFFSQPGSLKRHIHSRCKKTEPPAINDNAISNCEIPPQEEHSNREENMPRCYVKLVDMFKTKCCCLCDKRFLSAQKAKNHFLNVHEKNRSPDLLSKCIPKVSGATRQTADCENRDYKCPLCPRVFKYSYNRARHLRDCIRDSISGEKEKHSTKYPCPLCNTTFTTPSNRYRHIKTSCFKECLSQLAQQRATSRRKAENKNKETKQKTQSKEIQQTTQPKENEQNSTAKENGQEKTSQALTATKGIPRYKCNFCPAVFCHGSGKYRHMKKHKLFKLTGKMFSYRNAALSTIPKPINEPITDTPKAENSEDNLKSVEASNSLTLSCHFCGKCFDTSQSLKRHERNHRGERPYRCLECAKGFKKSCHLIAHKVVHQKRIQCTVCRKTFSTIGDLIQHRITHPKRGMLKCPECHLQFKFPAHLLRHLDVHKKRESKAVKLAEGLLSKPQQPSESMKDKLDSVQLQCSLCKELFDDAHVLRKHCLTHISGSSSHQCPFCKQQCGSRRYLLRHMIIHTGNKPFSCTNCGKQFYRNLYLKLHRERCLPTVNGHLVDSESNITTKGPKLCSFCPRVFNKKNRLKSHLNGHKKNTLLQCSKCGQYFGHRRLHLHRNHCLGTITGLSSKQCSYCPRVFTKKYRLKNHLIAHKMNTLLQCPRCRQYFGHTRLHLHRNYCTGTPTVSSSVDDDFKSPSDGSRKINPVSTQSNSNTSTLYMFKCSYCTQKFRYRSILLRHLVSHTGVQPYACIHCGHRFRSQTSCLQHEVFCVGNKNQDQSNISGDAVAQMSAVSDLKEAAQKTATGEDEFKCKFCTKTFIKPRNLRRHILTHNEVKPYRCKACDSCFSRYDHLKVHQARCKGKKRRLEVCIPKISLDDVGKGWQNKFGMKPTVQQETFDCKVCSKSFLSLSKLSRHNTLFHITKMFKCTRCGSSFAHEKSLKHHRKVNRCRRVSKETNTSLPQSINAPTETITKPPQEVIRQILQRTNPHLNKKTQYECSDCPRAFGSRWQLRVHSRLHTGEKPYSCQYCGLRFMRKDYMQRHFPKCTKRNLIEVLCDRCGGFFPQFQLEDHKSNCTSAPSLLKPTACKSPQSGFESSPKCFSCAYCNSRFLLFSQLQEHFLNEHKLETMVPPISTAPLQQHLSNMPKIKEEALDGRHDERFIDGANLICNLDTALDREAPKPLSCPECHMLFTNKAGLGGHMRVHEVKHPFTCTICKRGFWNKNLLRNHNRKCRLGCNSEKNANQQLEVPLKAEIDFAINDSVLVFKEGSKTTGTGVLQTNFSHKEDLMDESPHSSERIQVQDKGQERKAVQYQCSECDQSFTDGLMLISHLEDHGREEQEKRRNACTKCGRVCSSKGNLEKHMRMHGTDNKYPYLDKMDDNSDGLKSYLDISTTGLDSNRSFACKLCDQRFPTRVSLCNHYSEDHPEDVYKCRFCNKAYSVKKSLARHYKKWHLKEQNDDGNILQENGSNEEKSSTKVSESDEDENDGSEDSDLDSAPYFPCHVCGKTFPTSESLEDHQRCHLGEKPHECAECGRCFFQASQLQQHQRMHKSEFQCQACGRGFVSLFALRKHKHTHGKSRPYRCSKCHLSFTGPSQLAEHMYSHREENFPCDICDRVFLSKSSRAEHRKSHSKSSGRHPRSVLKEHEKSASLAESSTGFPKELKYRCGVCSKLFRDPEELSEHGCLENKERPYSCLDCNTYFLHASHLKKHRNTHHQSHSSLEYPCNQCSSRFSSPHQLFSHLNTHVDTAAEVKLVSEGPSNSFICPVCHLKLGSATELICHVPKHPDSKFECKLCRAAFPSNDKLEEHYQLHLTYPHLECIECGFTFLGRNAFLEHRFSCQQYTYVTKNSKPSATKSPQKHEAAGEEEEIDVPGDEIYNCPNCLMQFPSKSLLLEHQNKHHTNGSSKEKPFACELCGKLFALRRYLREHERRHLQKSVAQKRLKCTQCNAEFSLVQDLSLHMRVHAEEEAGLFRCDMCYKSFSQWSLLKQHQESHIGQVVYECTECDKAFAFPHLLDEHQKMHT